ncbi:kinase inhibitor [Enterovibrio norvegicus FF-33]|uniref:Kinase inhibitor n=1 Tax=Enterovibrio norvegicus FF-454 TaxID=1185651 RepID=A0A1E5BXG9_9GAMM|nr:YbhB/YbcL family Raf kinase inhibitor-like protein [Enterovibrio norvegicus]OEE57986.1 kinase inhibitor [Enterovibrio norvegicus FF-454]OEE70625.1 kinase inhibitor [Enterovibrio norvegicus FF-33]OEE88202.1 kinase inhibitor [Enterovibrio norvegicus FF-162]
MNKAKRNGLGIALSMVLVSMGTSALTLTSPQVVEGETLKTQQIFNQWGCEGDNKSPELRWTDIPEGTKSFAVTMYDPDAPTGSGWWHWSMINIPADVHHLQLNAGDEGGKLMPAGAQMQRNDFGFHGFGGACPPPKASPHNYQITVYALDVEKLGVPVNGSPALAGYYILQHRVGEAQLIAPTKARK